MTTDNNRKSIIIAVLMVLMGQAGMGFSGKKEVKNILTQKEKKATQGTGTKTVRSSSTGKRAVRTTTPSTRSGSRSPNQRGAQGKQEPINITNHNLNYKPGKNIQGVVSPYILGMGLGTLDLLQK